MDRSGGLLGSFGTRGRSFVGRFIFFHYPICVGGVIKKLDELIMKVVGGVETERLNVFAFRHRALRREQR